MFLFAWSLILWSERGVCKYESLSLSQIAKNINKVNMKKLFLMLATVALFCAGCSNGKKTELFNGSDLTGWVGYVDEATDIPADVVYTVNDGKICISGTPFGYLRTEKKYGDYTLHVEWRWVGEGTNSGLFQRVQDGDKLWCTAIECQLCSGKAGDFVMLGGAKIKEVECVGEYPVKDRIGDYENPVGEWNSADIICEGNSIKVMINGKAQNECTCEFVDGYIALQSEGGPIEFRNIYIVE